LRVSEKDVTPRRQHLFRLKRDNNLNLACSESDHIRHNLTGRFPLFKLRLLTLRVRVLKSRLDRSLLSSYALVSWNLAASRVAISDETVKLSNVVALRRGLV
jgi:hypothetical protein